MAVGSETGKVEGFPLVESLGADSRAKGGFSGDMSGGELGGSVLG